MKEKAAYISHICIENLWNRFRIDWELRPDVNILSGINGVGKTTILNRIIERLQQPAQTQKPSEETVITFSPSESQAMNFDVIRSYDRPLIMGEFTAQMADKHVASELDWQLYLLQRRYLDYQVNVGNHMIELLASGNEEDRHKASLLSAPKRRFQDLADSLLGYTGKTIDRKRNDIAFFQNGELLLPYQLSSGEKQLLLILLTVLVQDRQPYILIMDEPEASLHIEWQQKLIGIIRELNPCAQIILSTHSPALIMEGWMDAVTEVSDITTQR